MKKTTSASAIEEFFAQPAIGIVGVSRNNKKFGYSVYKEMRAKGINVYPVNPNADTIDGQVCYKSISDLPGDAKSVVLLSKKEITPGLMESAIAKGIKNIWVQQGAESPEVIQKAENNGLNVILGRCILMFAKPTGPHSFHRFILKIFGRLPK